MKFTLRIAIPSYLNPAMRFIEVPCRLPGAFNFTSRGDVFTALVDDLCLVKVEYDGTKDFVNYGSAVEVAESILATIKATLGLTGPVPPGSPLPAIALAYEAEVAAYDACMNAHGELPPILHSDAMYWINPSNGPGHSVRMLTKYVEHVVEQAAKVTP